MFFLVKTIREVVNPGRSKRGYPLSDWKHTTILNFGFSFILRAFDGNPLIEALGVYTSALCLNRENANLVICHEIAFEDILDIQH